MDDELDKLIKKQLVEMDEFDTDLLKRMDASIMVYNKKKQYESVVEEIDKLNKESSKENPENNEAYHKYSLKLEKLHNKLRELEKTDLNDLLNAFNQIHYKLEEHIKKGPK